MAEPEQQEQSVPGSSQLASRKPAGLSLYTLYRFITTELLKSVYIQGYVRSSLSYARGSVS